MEKQIELEKVAEAMKQAKDRRMYERYQAVFLHLKGTSMVAIADSLNRNRMTVSSYIHTYKNGGLTALQLGHSSGAPSRLTKEQQDQLKQTVACSLPHEVGFTSKHNWTLELIAAYVERQWGHRYSLRGISKVMERLGLSYTKLTYTLAAADPEKQPQFTETTFPHLKKWLNDDIDHLLFEGEFMIRDYQAIQKIGFSVANSESSKPRASTVVSSCWLRWTM